MFAALRHPPGPRARPEDRPGGGASTRAHLEVGPLGHGGRRGEAPGQLRQAKGGGAGGGDGLGRRCPQHHSQLIILVCMDFSNNN